jgi:rod shape-determining protein MreC
MWDFLRKQRGLFAGLFVLAVGLVFWGVEGRDATSQVTPVGSVLIQGGALAERASAGTLSPLSTFVQRFRDAGRARAEADALSKEVARTREENARLAGILQENARLRALVGFAAAHPRLELVPAKVIGADMTPWFRVTSLSVASGSSRVAVGQPVVSSAGVVGSVSEVAGGIVQVTLAVDPRSSIDVVVQRNRARGVVQGLGHSDDYLSKIAYLLRRDEVKEGDLLVTSGIGGKFPPDLLVGRVSKLVASKQGLFQEAMAEPAVDFGRLEEVFIILGEKER